MFGAEFKTQEFLLKHCCRHAALNTEHIDDTKIISFSKVFKNSHLSHIVRMGLSVEHLVDVGEVRVGHGIVIAEKIQFQNQVKKLEVC